MSSMSIILKSLLLATTLLGASIAEETEFITYNALTVPIGSHLFTVSKYPRHIIINSTDVNYASCVAELDVIDPDRAYINAAAIASKKIVVVGLQRYRNAAGSKLVITYTVRLIDPYTCSVKVVESPNELAIHSPLIKLPEVVARADNTFDLFYWSQKACSPCRYDAEGRRIQLQHELKPDSYGSLTFHLHVLGRDGEYAYSSNNQIRTSMLKVFDRDFNVVSSVSVGTIMRDFASGNVGDASYIGAALTVPGDDNAFNYSMFEFKSELQPVFSRLVRLAGGERIYSASPILDSRGTSYVAHWNVATKPDGTTIKLTRFDANGRVLGDTVVIGRVAYKQEHRVQTLLLEDKQYCLVIHEAGWRFDVTKIKCVDVGKMM